MNMVSTDSVVCLYVARLKSQLLSIVLEWLSGGQIQVMLDPTLQTDTPLLVHASSTSTSAAQRTTCQH